MGYTTTFTGEVRIVPPLNAAEREYLRKFGASRRIARPGGPYALGGAGDEELDEDRQNTPPRGQPGLWCQWVPNDDGTALLWDGHEKFYRSSAWMRYLIDTFLRPGARLRQEMRYSAGADLRTRFAGFTFDHVLNGDIVARGQDGAVWQVEVVNNDVAVHELAGAAPVEYAVFVVPRHDDFTLDREFDAAFDLGGNQFARIRFDDEDFGRRVHDCVRSVHPALEPGDVEGMDSLVDGSIGLRVTIVEDGVRIGLLAEPGFVDADRNVELVQRLVAALTADLGWIAFDPAQCVAVRPTAAYRARVIDRVGGWMDEPEGRYLWNVM